MKQTLCVMITFLLALSLVAAPTLIIPPTGILTTVEINWTACPTSPEAIISETIWLDSISFGVAGTGRTVNLADKQSSPITPLTTIALTANQFTTIALAGGRFGGGMTLTCSGAGVVYQFRGRVKR